MKHFHISIFNNMLMESFLRAFSSFFLLLPKFLFVQVGAEMAHQLYVLQTLMLSLLEQRMMTKMDPQDQDAHDKIKELRKIAFDTEGANSGDVAARKQGLFAKDYKKLGFKYDINPALDFTETPPGMLALDCMVYFARNHTEAYTKVVLENSCRADEHECPFGRTSVELVKLLCEVRHLFIIKIRNMCSRYNFLKIKFIIKHMLYKLKLYA